MAKSIEEFVRWQEQIAADNSHGYDQAHRNGPDYDCSSLCGTALNRAGFNVSPASTTRNLYQQLVKEGWTECRAPWKRGDIHLKVGSHVVTSIDANNIVHASINENGGARGGRVGDQTGREICTRSYYEKGWDYHLRYTGGSSSEKPASSSGKTSVSYKNGNVYTLQTELKVRKGPGTSYPAVKRSELTKSAKQSDKDKDGCLDKGTRVTCLETKKNGNDIWMRIPSGWVAAYYSSKRYIK